MNYRTVQLLSADASSTDRTKVIEINVRDPISRIQVLHRGYNTAAVAATAHPVAGITKIELVDGSDVLFSLSGYEAQALDFYHNKRLPNQWLHYMSNNWYDCLINLNFGRFLYDPELALDPKNFNNLQLKISVDVDAGGIAPSNSQLIVYANLFDEKEIDPVGFLMQKEIKSYSLADATHEYTDLPTDYSYRKLLIRAQKAGSEPESVIQTAKLSEDQDKRVVFDDLLHALSRLVDDAAPRVTDYFMADSSSSLLTLYCTPTQIVSGSVMSYVSASPSYHSFAEGDGGRFKIIAASAKVPIITVTGFLPHGVIEIPFGLQNEISDWYDVKAVGNLRLDTLSGSGMSSTESAQVFLQQLREY